jgi:hypothetical protein
MINILKNLHSGQDLIERPYLVTHGHSAFNDLLTGQQMQTALLR